MIISGACLFIRRTSSRLHTAGNSVIARLVRVVGSGRLVARRQLQFGGRVVFPPHGRKDTEEERDEDRHDEIENEVDVSHGIVPSGDAPDVPSSAHAVADQLFSS